MMKYRNRLTPCFLLALLGWASSATAQNLLVNGNFTSVTYTQTTPVLTTLYGQFGSDPAGSPASGATLRLGGWDTGGYNFVFAPGTVDGGTSAAGANSGIAKEAPGQYKVGGTGANAGYGSTYLWGANNGGLTTVPTQPFSGNFVAGDGAFEVGSINQTVTGLTIGTTYAVTFWWSAAQQQSYDGDTVEQWKVNLGNSALTAASTTYQITPSISLPSHTFASWRQQTDYFTAGGTSQVLSFLAAGTPTGEPPFSLLGGVSLMAAPEPSSLAVFAAGAAALVAWGTIRRRKACRAAGSGE